MKTGQANTLTGKPKPAPNHKPKELEPMYFKNTTCEILILIFCGLQVLNIKFQFEGLHGFFQFPCYDFGINLCSSNLYALKFYLPFR